MIAGRWRGLVDLVARLRPRSTSADPSVSLRERAAWLAISEFGKGAAQQTPGLVNLGALAIQSRGSPEVWLVRPSASATVHATDLHSIPDVAPRMLRAPGVVETRRPETGEVLWADFASLAWYQVDDAYYLLGLRYPDGYAVARWRPRWTGGELADEMPERDESPLVDDVDDHQAFARQAARYLIVIGLLAESEPSPLRIELDKRERKTRHVYPRDTERRADHVERPEIEGVVERVLVRGHLKRQRHGLGHALTKWIYVQQHSARRWFAPRWIVERANRLNTRPMPCARCGGEVAVERGHLYYDAGGATVDLDAPVWGRSWRCVHRDPKECGR